MTFSRTKASGIRWLWGWLWAWLWLAGALSAAERRAVTFEDILAVKSVSNPAVSPDGRAVVYVVAAWEKAKSDAAETSEKMESVSHLFRVPAAGGEAIQPAKKGRARRPGPPTGSGSRSSPRGRRAERRRTAATLPSASSGSYPREVERRFD